jgi:hypothetical protein
MGASKLRYAYDLGGSTVPMIRSFPIATGTVIEEGEMVKIAGGFVVAIGDADQDDPYLGIAAEAHDGATVGQTGLTIRVYCSPTAVFKCKPNVVSTADSGNGTTWVDGELVAGAGFADDVLNGGNLKLSEKAVASTLTVAVGTVFPITDFAVATGTCTGVFAGSVVAGDKAIILPPVGSKGWDLNSDGTNLDLKANGGESIIIIDVDTDTEEVYLKLRLHQLSEGVVAI